MEGFSTLMPLVIVEGAISVVLIALLIHRSILGFREEDQIFLGRAEAAMEKEYAATLQRILRLNTLNKRLAITLGGLVFLIAALSIYQGLYH